MKGVRTGAGDEHISRRRRGFCSYFLEKGHNRAVPAIPVQDMAAEMSNIQDLLYLDIEVDGPVAATVVPP
jgi:hypothetical protein